MITFEVYKFLHLVFLMILIVTFSLNYFYPQQTPTPVKILFGICKIMLLVTGMGMLSRLNIPHIGPRPLWVNLKLVLWLVFSILSAVAIKRFKLGKWAFMFFMAILFAAAYVGVFKPE